MTASQVNQEFTTIVTRKGVSLDRYTSSDWNLDLIEELAREVFSSIYDLLEGSDKNLIEFNISRNTGSCYITVITEDLSDYDAYNFRFSDHSSPRWSDDVVVESECGYEVNVNMTLPFELNQVLGEVEEVKSLFIN